MSLEKETQLLSMAVSLVTSKLRGARRNGEPQYLHSLRVGNALAKDLISDIQLEVVNKYHYNTVIAGYLHDVVEDSDVTIEEIKEIFGEKISSIVDEVTFDTSYDENNLSTNNALIKQLTNISPEANVIKLYDRIDNMKNLENSSSKQLVKFFYKTICIYSKCLGWDNPDSSTSFVDNLKFPAASIKKKLTKIWDLYHGIYNQRCADLQFINRFKAMYINDKLENVTEYNLQEYILNNILDNNEEYYNIFIELLKESKCHRTFFDLTIPASCMPW